MRISTEMSLEIHDNDIGNYIKLAYDKDIGEYLQIWNSETPTQVLAVLPEQIPELIKAIQMWYDFHLTRRDDTNKDLV